MKLATLVYRQYLASSGIRRKAWSLLRKAMIKLLSDPACSFPIHEMNIKLPLSHSLPAYLKQFPFYDRLPQRISEYIHQKQEHLNCIDVGANVGDTLASFYKNEADAFLAIEPNPKFNKLLSENWGWNNNVKVVSDICSGYSDESTFAIQEKNGTASILQSEGGFKMRRRPLDEILSDYPFAENVDVLKIDTDGHDFEVIKGAIGSISKHLPMVLFECDAFADTNYVEHCLKTLLVFKKCGYKHFLLYDNFGYLIGKFTLSDLSPFRNLLFYQLTSSFYYFDILIMKDEDLVEFYKDEINYFTEKMPNKSLQRTAISAAEL